MINFSLDLSSCICLYYYRPKTKFREGNVSVFYSVHRGGVKCDHYLQCIGHHCTGPYASPGPSSISPGHQTWDPPALTPPLLVTPGDYHRRPVQSCSLEDPTVSTSSGHQSMYSWQMGGITSYWKAFLFDYDFC